MNLENLNLVELDREEIISIEGGKWAEWLASQIVDNWDDIKKGLRDGFNAGSR
ncbi:hypothetical protein [Flavobacterium chungbukense]|uniref:Bacteriocin n=1 Tax=Flavobacterium chungbukense TaxID=877464 RepID=A0ABP7YLW7_9FLAO|nr:hypothetical protein [Flavobacterium chungbukense]MCC4919899.1 hypothetical protein [Flavobacterium chungbukense]